MSPPKSPPGFLYSLDAVFRRSHWKWNRTRGGLLERWLPLSGHTPGLMVAFGFLVFALCIGPTSRTGYWQFSILWAMAALSGYLFTAFRWPTLHQKFAFWFQVTTIGLLALFAFWNLLPLPWHSAEIEVRMQNAREFDSGMFPHLLFLLVGLNISLASIARIGARFVLNSVSRQFSAGDSVSDTLHSTTLFVRPDKTARAHWSTLLLTAVTVPLRFPLELFFLPSAYLLLFDQGEDTHRIFGSIGVLFAALSISLSLRQYHRDARSYGHDKKINTPLWLSCVWLPAIAFLIAVWVFQNYQQFHYAMAAVILLVCWLALAAADVFPRLVIRSMARRLLLRGGLRFVSVLVILLAVCWVTRFSYVHTLLEGNRNVILWFLTSLYVTYWWHEYWVNRTMSEEILRFLAPNDLFDKNRLDFRIYRRHNDNEVEAREEAETSGDAKTSSESDASTAEVASSAADAEQEPSQPAPRQTIQIHGSAELVVWKTLAPTVEDSSPDKEQFEFYNRSELLKTLAAAAGHKDVSRTIRRLRTSLRAYFTTLNLLIFAAVIVFFTIVSADRLPSVVAPTDNAANVLSATSLLPAPVEADAVDGGTEPTPGPRMIAVCASGGGTRAALFATAVLEGLHNAGALKDIRLLSGVSGGGVALTYFATHREALEDDAIPANGSLPKTDSAWDTFYEAMSNDFVGDVLRGSTEWRMARGHIWGELLAESFERTFFPGEEIPATESADQSGPKGLLMKDLDSRTGLILNTAICGEFPARFSNYFTNEDRSRQDYATILDSAGTRLIFTNVACGNFFERFQRNTYFPGLQYIVVQDGGVRTTTAAALQANFPPVFPNAGIDLNTTAADGADLIRRYWVTDGGAQENLGLISLLTVLAGQLESVKDEVLPELFVIACEASAGSVTYQHTLAGTTALTQARAEFAKGIEQFLLDALKTRYAKVPDRLHLHYLPMPSVLRMGGFNTHWRLAPTMRIQVPTIPATPQAQSIRLLGEEMLSVMKFLHRTDAERREHWKSVLKRPPRKDIDRLWEFIRNDPLAATTESSDDGKTFDRYMHIKAWENLKAELAKSN